jgi:hypothetical protein
MEVGQGPNWGCSAKEKKKLARVRFPLRLAVYRQSVRLGEFLPNSILSRIRCYVTNNNGFWILWLDLLALLYNYNQLWQLAINDCLRLAPFLTGLRASSLPLWRMTNEGFCSRLELPWTTSVWRILRLFSTTPKVWVWVLCYDRRQPASLSWNKAPIWGLRPDLDYCQTFAGFLIWGVLSDERTGLSFTIAVGPRQRSHFRVRIP